MADYFVVATGTSRPHVLALAEHVRQNLKDMGFKEVNVEGEGEAEWVLVDAGDIVVHIFQPEARQLYRLERLWGRSFEADDNNDEDTQLDLTAT